jgi:hypothetical protein
MKRGEYTERRGLAVQALRRFSFDVIPCPAPMPLVLTPPRVRPTATTTTTAVNTTA